MSQQDTKVRDLMAKVEEKRKLLGKKKRFIPVTNAKFVYVDGTFMNLNVESNISNYIKALSFLLVQQSYYSDACSRLGVEPDTFKWEGYTLEEWETDFKARVDIILWNKRKRELDATEKKLNELLSQEGKTAAALDDIASLLA